MSSVKVGAKPIDRKLKGCFVKKFFKAKIKPKVKTNVEGLMEIAGQQFDAYTN